ncbi:hypothetical protein GGR54DRAFT_350242 [Hypoxylon sp. NC1633]|nr:hypothetical protein GGR54DRAFT_350242 [Hypoxylon sp. NC1633]
MSNRVSRNYLKAAGYQPAPRSASSRGRSSSVYSSSSSYPDAWMANKDPRHQTRANLYKWRRDSIASNSSRPSTATESCRSTSTARSPGTEVDIKHWHHNTPWAIARQRKSTIGGDNNTPGRSMTPVQLRDALQDELDRYDNQRQLLSRNEWLAPPTPRGRARRFDPKQFNIERVRSLKRWSQVEALMYGQISSSLRDTDMKQPLEVYAPGVIFSAPHHTSSTPDELYVMVDDPNLTATPFGTICSKYRKMIVLRVFGEHLTCLPIYTHNGQGLEGKNFTEEYVSIRDLDDPSPEPDEGPHRGLRAVKNADFTGTFIRGKSCVKLTEIYTHRYDAPATIEGKLDVAGGSKRSLFENFKLLGN